MPDWQLVALGVIVGLGVIVATIRLAFGTGARVQGRTRTNHHIGREDRGPSVGTSNDPIGGD